MPTEKLTIKNFKGISNLEIDVKPFTVLIGPQSVGKSLTAKLLFYFKSLPRQTFNAAIDDTDESLDKRLLERFVKLLPPPYSSTGKPVVEYSIDHLTFSLWNDTNKNSNWKIKLPEFIEADFLRIKENYAVFTKEERKSIFADLEPVRTSLQDHYFKKIEAMLGEKVVPVVWFIPAGRSFYAQIERDFISFFESANVDPFVALFGRFLPHLKESNKFRSVKQGGAVLLADELMAQLLSGKYEQEGRRDFIRLKDGIKLPSGLWSSGQQESFPLALHMQRWIEGEIQSDQRAGVFIEEPEAHLFPRSQRIMMELIALAFNSAPKGTNIFITTHSPYVLTTLNNLLMAGQLFYNKSNGQKESISNIVPESEALAPGTVGAYYMDQEKCKSIMDSETGLIDGRAIDDVSGELAEQFDALCDVQ